jgi:hypothetical protein
MQAFALPHAGKVETAIAATALHPNICVKFSTIANTGTLVGPRPRAISETTGLSSETSLLAPLDQPARNAGCPAAVPGPALPDGQPHCKGWRHRCGRESDSLRRGL